MTVKIASSDVHMVRRLIASSKSLTLDEARSLDISLAITDNVWVGMYNDQVACAWGVIPPTLLSDQAYLWLYATEAVKAHEFLFVRYSQRVVELLLEEYPLITGMTDPQMPGSIRWLKWLGAKFGEPIGRYVPFTIRKR